MPRWQRRSSVTAAERLSDAVRANYAAKHPYAPTSPKRVAVRRSTRVLAGVLVAAAVATPAVALTTANPSTAYAFAEEASASVSVAAVVDASADDAAGVGATAGVEADEDAEAAANVVVEAETEIGAEAAGDIAVAAEQDDDAVKTVDIDAPTGYKDNLTTLSRDITTADGQNLRVLIGSVTAENSDAVADAISANLDFSTDTPLKLVHADFVDAEKWNTDSNKGLNDSALCWAASTASVLWSSGWAKQAINPATGAYFTSEDEVFTYFTENFRNTGGEAQCGLDWFFDGVYQETSFNGTPWLLTDENMARFPNLVASSLYVTSSLTGDYSALSVLEKAAGANPYAFEVSVGTLSLGEVSISTHALTSLGVVIDPTATDAATRYRAIIIANSDDDGTPTIPIKGSTDAERIANRAARPNSYTIYQLEAITDKNGVQCWKVLGYGDEDEEPTILVSLVGMPWATSELAETATETEGSRDPYADPDFAISVNYMTTEDRTNGFFDDGETTTFSAGDDVYFTFHMMNKNMHTPDQGEYPNVSLKMTLTGPNGYVRTWTESVKAESYAPMVYLVSVKVADAATLPAGAYALSVEVNPLVDGARGIAEAYYLNNGPTLASFTVIGDEPAPEPQPEPTPAPTPGTGAATKAAAYSVAGGATLAQTGDAATGPIAALITAVFAALAAAVARRFRRC